MGFLQILICTTCLAAPARTRHTFIRRSSIHLATYINFHQRSIYVQHRRQCKYRWNQIITTFFCIPDEKEEDNARDHSPARFTARNWLSVQPSISLFLPMSLAIRRLVLTYKLPYCRSLSQHNGQLFPHARSSKPTKPAVQPPRSDPCYTTNLSDRDDCGISRHDFEMDLLVKPDFEARIAA